MLHAARRASPPRVSGNTQDRPGRAVRRQTGDLIGLLEAARGRGAYYLFLEDDFRRALY